jgi:hypothetical protein
MATNVVDFVMTLPKTLRRNNRLVLFTLATYADTDGGSIRPGLERLSRETAVCRTALRPILAKLQALGYLIEVAPPRQHRAREYRIPLKSRGPVITAPLKAVSRGAVSTSRGAVMTGPDPSLDPSIDPSVRTRESFAAFWHVYPKKENQEDAWTEWQRLRPDCTLLATMVAALEWQVTKSGWTRDGGRYIPEPAKRLRKRRWTDQPSTAPAVSDRTAMLGRAMKGFLSS